MNRLTEVAAFWRIFSGAIANCVCCVELCCVEVARVCVCALCCGRAVCADALKLGADDGVVCCLGGGLLPSFLSSLMA